MKRGRKSEFSRSFWVELGFWGRFKWFLLKGDVLQRFCFSDSENLTDANERAKEGRG